MRIMKGLSRFMPGAAAIAAALLAFPGAGLPAEAEVISRGSQVYDRCRACHSLERDRTGPRHCGLVGRQAGSVSGFPYSRAMRGARFVWDEAMLDRFLSDPRGTVPGNRMGYAGIDKADDRQALIAYLAWIDGPDGPCSR